MNAISKAAAFIAGALAILFASPVAAASHGHAHHAIHQGAKVGGARLPYAPEYGFLSHIPSNAIRMPGYTFVPGVGILGESCDLPTSACPNEDRID
jgi:hypothetical protein